MAFWHWVFGRDEQDGGSRAAPKGYRQGGVGEERGGSSPNPGAPGKEWGSHHAALSRRNAAGGRERRRRRSDF